MNQKKNTALTSRIMAICLIFLNSCIVCIMRLYIPSISLLTMVGISVLIYKFLFQINISSSITVTIISYGITYLQYLISVLFIIIIQAIYPPFSFVNDSILFTTISFFQVLLAILLFKIRRFSHGFPFLSDSKYGDISVYISVSILLVVSFLGMEPKKHYIIAILTYFLFICGMLLWFWCKKRISQQYLEQVHKREILDLKETVIRLQKDNDTLSEIIHKDNKLIPALELSVKTFLISVAQNDCKKERISSAQELIEQIEHISSERAGIVKRYEQSDISTPQTGIPIIDALFSLMAYKAMNTHTTINFVISSNIKQMLNTVISEENLSTLLADLIENALIAVAHTNKEKRILVELLKENEIYCIKISDNGVPFPQEVLNNLGIQRITTHKDSGGCGIGMMSICKICKENNASFTIKKFSTEELYSKTITIRFDGLGSINL